ARPRGRGRTARHRARPRGRGRTARHGAASDGHLRTAARDGRRAAPRRPRRGAPPGPRTVPGPRPRPGRPARAAPRVRRGGGGGAGGRAARPVRRGPGRARGPEHPEVLGLRELTAYIDYLAGRPEPALRTCLDLAAIHRRAGDAEAAYSSVRGAATAWRAVRDPHLGLELGRELVGLWAELAADEGPAADEPEEL